MGQHASARDMVAAVHADAPAENLFFSQYRFWMAGYSTRDMDFWDCAWDALARVLRRKSAKALYVEFHLFTRVLNQQARRKVEWRPDICRCLCRDEFLVLRLVAASQRNDQREELAVASELLGADEIQALVMASRSLAEALAGGNFVLGPIMRLESPPASAHSSPGRTLQ